MGGMFKSPTLPVPPPLPNPHAQEEKLLAEEREARLEDIARRRRGRAGTLNTSWKGMQLQQKSDENTNKKLLGD